MKRLLTLSLIAALAFVSCKEDDPAPVKVSKITLDETAVSLEPETTKQLTVTEVLPENAADKTVTWASSDDAVATVNAEGLVTVPATAADKATATITATANDGSGVKGTCTVTVSFVKVASITLDKATMTLAPGKTGQLSVTEVLPENAADKTVVWSTSNTAVATVDAEGLVTVLATATDGATATITATANDGGGVTATCTVDVNIAIAINGVLWASSNVDAPGTFATAPEATGMFYQWNRKKGWPFVKEGTVEGWDSSNATGDSWDAANDPCPTGWRVPTAAEMESLISGSTQAAAVVNSVNCIQFTDKTSGDILLFPVAGYCNTATGLNLAKDTAYPGLGYWTSDNNGEAYPTQAKNATSWSPLTGQIIRSANIRGYGYSVRCVRK